MISWRLRAYVLATRAVSATPRSVSYAAARALGRLAVLVPSARKAALTGNIAVAHGLPAGDARVRHDVRRAFQHAFLNYVDLFGLERHDAPELIDSISVEDWSPFLDAEAKGKGVILFSAHIGNFDTVVQKLAIRGRRVLIPVENIEPADLLEAVRARRASLGMDVVPVGPDTFKQMTAHVRSGGTVVIVCDRDIQGSGVPVTFFGRTVLLPQAAVLLALRTGAPLLGAFGVRYPDNRIGGRFTPEVEAWRRQGDVRSSSLRDAVDRGMAETVAIIAREIRRDPGQWVMQQAAFAKPAPAPALRSRAASRRGAGRATTLAAGRARAPERGEGLRA